MSGARACGGASAPFQIAGQARRVQKRDMLFPRQTDQDAEIVFLRRVQQPFRRHGVGADGVDAAGGHLRKIPRHECRGGKFAARIVRSERAVGDAANVEFFLAGEQKFAGDAQARRFSTHGGRRSRRRRNVPDGRSGDGFVGRRHLQGDNRAR